MRYQYGISAVIPQTSFHGETSAEAKKNWGCFLRLGGVKTETITTLGRLKYDSNSNKNIKKLKQLCTCITRFTFLCLLDDFNKKFPHFMFMEEIKRENDFLFLFLNWPIN